MEIILASDSPRRKELLQAAGITFTVVSPSTDEKVFPRRPAQSVRRNAENKAKAIARSHPDAIIIAADTVVYRKHILGKPANLAQARKMLTMLSGKRHRVYSAVTVHIPSRNVTINKVVVTRVRMKKLDRPTIEAYFKLVNPLDKAGAYAIQESGEMVVKEINGSYSNVVGLPLEALEEVLRAIPEGTGLLPLNKERLGSED